MARKLNILYIGGQFHGCTGNDRRRALEALGHKVTAFDTDPYFRHKSCLERRIFGPLKWSPAIWAMNRTICRLSERIDYNLVWVSKGIFLFPKTVKALRRNSNIRLIHYTPDPFYRLNGSRHFKAAIRYYDICATTKSWEVNKYQKFNAKKIILVPKSVDLERFEKVESTEEDLKRFRSDVCFVGHHEPHYVSVLKKVSTLNLDLKIWGPWLQHLSEPRLKSCIQGPGAWGDDYVRALSGAKIALGLLSKLIPEQITQRSTEIPAAGTFMLAERTAAHLEFFKEGEEAEFFSSGEEMIDKIKYYLCHPEQRKRIARAGRERCVRSGYDHKECLNRVINAAIT